MSKSSPLFILREEDGVTESKPCRACRMSALVVRLLVSKSACSLAFQNRGRGHCPQSCSSLQFRAHSSFPNPRAVVSQSARSSVRIRVFCFRIFIFQFPNPTFQFPNSSFQFPNLLAIASESQFPLPAFKFPNPCGRFPNRRL